MMMKKIKAVTSQLSNIFKGQPAYNSTIKVTENLIQNLIARKSMNHSKF